MSEGMDEYQMYKFLRLQYPEKLTREQQLEILDKLPEDPKRDDMVSLALSYDYNFKEPSELELYFMYQIKLSIGYLKKHIIAENTKYVGMIFPVHLYNFFSILADFTLADAIPFDRQKELVQECFDGWKVLMDPEDFEFAKESVQQRLDISYATDTKYPERFDKYKKQKTEALAFIQNLITPKIMKTITLQTAVLLTVKELLALGSFSAYEATIVIRNRADVEYTLSDQTHNGVWTEVNHLDVRDIIVELFDNGVFEATRTYGQSGGNSYTIYNPIVVNAPNASAAPLPFVPTTTPVGADLARIKAYLANKKQATVKQIQSALKTDGLLCVDILNILGVDPTSIVTAPSKYLVRY